MFLANLDAEIVRDGPWAFDVDGSADGEVTLTDVAALLGMV